MVVYVYENCSLFSWKLVKGLASKPEKKKPTAHPLEKDIFYAKLLLPLLICGLGVQEHP